MDFFLYANANDASAFVKTTNQMKSQTQTRTTKKNAEKSIKGPELLPNYLIKRMKDKTMSVKHKTKRNKKRVHARNDTGMNTNNLTALQLHCTAAQSAHIAILQLR